VAWFISLAAALVCTALWRDPIYQWFSGHMVTFVGLMIVFLLLVAIGNLIPGIPNMPAPLIAGWACTAGMCAGWTTALGLMVVILASFGSAFGYVMGNMSRRDSDFLSDFELDSSAQYRTAYRFYKESSQPIFWSRFWKKAALCGHVNIIAGLDDEQGVRFCTIAAYGHFLWTCQYIVIGIAIGYLPEILDFLLSFPFFVWAAIFWALITTVVAYFVRHYRVVRIEKH